jgi:Lon protease-like protein
MSTCRSFLHRLQQGTAPWVVQRLSSTYGAIPTDPSAFSFWVALVLPIDEHEKAKLLPLRSARLRLLLLVHWIEQLNSQWYALVWKVVACFVWTVFVLTISRLVGFI